MDKRSARFSFLLLLALGWAGLAPAASAEDPPGRVGRIGHVEGQVWWSEKYDAPAQDAQRNWPVTYDNVIATGDGRAEVRIGPTAIALDRDSEIEFARLDDDLVRVRLLQGRIALHLRSRDAARELELSTPFGRVRPLEGGRYRLEVDRGGDLGMLTVFEGHARFEGSGPGLAVAGGEMLRIDGGSSTRLEPARRSEFDDWHLAHDRAGEPRALRYVPAEMTGYEDLDDYGDWRDHDDYGAVWIPRGISSDWAPYRHGRWAWVEPWGWTWIDDMPWGFAPFHYGRWVRVGGHWAWVPGRIVARPVYAPALVVWIGSPGVGVHIGSSAAVGWFPLGPREVFVPAYRHSRDHLHRINHGHVTRIEHADVARFRYRHRDAPHAVTLVSRATVTAGRPVHREVVRIGERGELRRLTPAAVPRDLRPEPGGQRGGSEAAQRWRERHRVADRARDEPRRGAAGGAAAAGREQAYPGANGQRPDTEARDGRRGPQPRQQESRPGEERQRVEERLRQEERLRAEERLRRDERQRVEARQRAEQRQAERQREESRRILEGQRQEERQRAEAQRREVERQRVEVRRRMDDERRAQEDVRHRAQEDARMRERAEREQRSAREAQLRSAQEAQRRAEQEQQRRRMQEERRQDLERRQREVPHGEPGSAASAAREGGRWGGSRQGEGGRQGPRAEASREPLPQAGAPGAAAPSQGGGKRWQSEASREPRNRN